MALKSWMFALGLDIASKNGINLFFHFSNNSKSGGDIIIIIIIGSRLPEIIGREKPPH
jgi:hypothetical protein